MLPDHEQSHRT